MGMDDLKILALWDLAPPPLPPRSRLYCLPPVGSGTPAVESLTGYVARLAGAHGVPVRTLVVHEILPLLGRSYLLGAVNKGLSAFWQGETKALNGTRSMARDLVRVLEALTRRDDLGGLTMLPWAAVVPSHGLLRRQRAWCPACYDAWRRADHPIYEPLLWALQPVMACPHHRRRLQERCPYADCQRSLPLLGQRSCPGYCSACTRWLGVPTEHELARRDELTDAEWRTQTWVVQAIGELLASAPNRTVCPTRQQMAGLIAAAIEAVAGGNMSRFARELGLSLVTVSQWRGGKAIPSLALLLHLCHGLGTTPLRLLTEDVVRAPPRTAERPAVERTGLIDPTHRQPLPRRAFDATAIRLALEAVLASAEQPPPAMRQVALRLGRTHPDLIHHFPALCHAISARYLAYQQAKGAERRRRLGAEIRQAVVRLHEQGHYPSASRIAPLISQPGFVRDPEANAARKQALRALGWRP